MKYLLFTLFVFLIHISIAIFNATNVFEYGVQEDTDFLKTVDKAELESQTYISNQISQDNDWSAGDYVKATFMFVGTLGLGLFAVPYTLSLLGVPYPFAYYFSLPVYFMYMVAFIQIISKDSYSTKQ